MRRNTTEASENKKEAACFELSNWMGNRGFEKEMTKWGLGKWPFSNTLNKQDETVSSTEEHDEMIAILKAWAEVLQISRTGRGCQPTSLRVVPLAAAATSA